MLVITYREHNTNEYAWQQANILAGHQELFLSTVKRRKLSWFGHVCRHDTLPKIYKEQWMVIVAEEDHVNQGGLDRPVVVVIASHCG